MKNNKISLIISIVALVGVLLLFVDKMSDKDNDSNNTHTPQATGDIKIAYVNLDSVLNDYDLYNVLSLQLTQKQQDLQNELQTKSLSLQNRANQLQQQYSQHLITTQTYQEKGQKMSDEQIQLQQWQETKAYELQEDQMLMTQRVLDSVNNIIAEFNANGKYDFIINTNFNNMALLYGNPNFNISDTIITLLNKKINTSALDSTLIQ